MASSHPNEAIEVVNNISEFSTNLVFGSCDDLIDWAQKLGRSLGYVIIIKQKKKNSSWLITKVLLICDRGGIYKRKKISSRHTGTKKINCPFELQGKYSKFYNFWTVSVLCEIHNHEPVEHFEGHAYIMRLSDNENRLVADLTRLNVKPHDILTTIKEQNPENVSTLKSIYNTRDKIKMNEKAGKTDIQVLLSFLQEGGYTYFYRENDISHAMEDLFFMHPTSLQLWHAFPYVILMEATYKTNKYNMPLLEIVGVTPTHLTFCIAFVFMHKEREFNYTWVLNCLRSVIGTHACPLVIVTDRELALMNACNNVFPEAGHLLCRWHIFESIKTNCRGSIRPLDIWSFFTKSLASLLESQTKEAYEYNLAQLQTLLLGYKGVLDYLNTVWLKYKHMFIYAWIDRFLNFGNHTNNRAASVHANLKNYLDTTQSDLWTCVTYIHKVIGTQFTSIKASLQQSIKTLKHRFDPGHFSLLWCSVSLHALNILFNDLEQINASDLSCNCQLRMSHGLPCVHEQMYYLNAGVPIPLDSIHMFWRKLNLHPSVAVQVFPQNYEIQSTSLREPVVQVNNRGRPSSKHKTSKNSRETLPAEQPRRHGRSNTYGDGLNVMENHEPTMHSSNAYIDQFPYILHLYISHVHDVAGDGNCGFRAIAACHGRPEDDWYKIWAELLEELNAHQTEYDDMFGSQTRYEIYNSLNFFRSDIVAPVANWLTFPETGILIASRYNVILYSIYNVVSTTYFPLWSTPPPTHEHVAIAIGFVNNNHYVRVVLRDEYPMPHVYLQWDRYRRPCAAAWINPYIDRINLYAQLSSFNRNI